MASNDIPSVSNTANTQSVQIPSTLQSLQQQADELRGTTSVEMSQLPAQQYATNSPKHTAQSQQSDIQGLTSSLPQPTISQPAQPTVAIPIASNTVNTSTITSLPQEPPAAVIAGQTGLAEQQHLSTEPLSAIGPSSEGPISPTSASHNGPVVFITLLLITGARHPYTIDQRYLRRRNVAGATEDMDPFSISVYTMKELIWRDWREEWETRPASPGAIRLIHFGKLLDDKLSLRDCRFQPATPNVVHMTIKPAELMEDEENTKAGKAPSTRHRASSNAEDPGCRCCVIQ